MTYVHVYVLRVQNEMTAILRQVQNFYIEDFKSALGQKLYSMIYSSHINDQTVLFT